MIWLDLLVVTIILGAAVAQSRRQFGSTLLDLMAVLGAVGLARLVGPRLARAAAILPAGDNNQALATAVMFVICAVSLLVLAELFQNQVLLTLESFDSVVGAVLGFASGVAVAHLVLVVILTANPATDATSWGTVARKRPAVRQLIYFEGYHQAMTWLRYAGEPERRS
ncbi:MAG TPA: CvpA family protein [Armatimonadota bacterium]|nr:CvpA family protein [Armatimonadota bacterium]